MDKRMVATMLHIRHHSILMYMYLAHLMALTYPASIAPGTAKSHSGAFLPTITTECNGWRPIYRIIS